MRTLLYHRPTKFTEIGWPAQDWLTSESLTTGHFVDFPEDFLYPGHLWPTISWTFPGTTSIRVIHDRPFRGLSRGFLLSGSFMTGNFMNLPGSYSYPGHAQTNIARNNIYTMCRHSLAVCFTANFISVSSSVPESAQSNLCVSSQEMLWWVVPVQIQCGLW